MTCQQIATEMTEKGYFKTCGAVAVGLGLFMNIDGSEPRWLQICQHHKDGALRFG